MGGGKPYPPPLPERDEYVVEFDGHDDPLHPQNWKLTKKLYIGAILAFTCVCSTFSSSIFSTSTQHVADHFGVSKVVAVLSSSLFILGYAFGPSLWAPFSELQGPVAVAKDLQTVMIGRFFGGFFGSCPLSVVAAVFADIFDNTQRGTAIVIFSTTVFLGPMLGPFIGGFINMSYLGWRWTEYLVGIMGFTAFTLNVFFLEESYPPVVLVSKASELRRRTKNWGIHAKQEEVEVDLRELVTKNFSRPLRLLVTEPVVFLVSFYMSFIYGGILFSAGLFWFGWTSRSSVHWIVPILSGLFTGFGLLAIFIQLFNYLIDSYLMFAASAIAANTLLRSCFAAGFPLFAEQMFNGMGIDWASTLLGCIAAVLVPIPIWFYLYGHKLREKSKFAPTFPVKPPSSEEQSTEENGGLAQAPLQEETGDMDGTDERPRDKE
ncbi:putative mfs multidrug [Phaeomoniella chlamydospora]|uniref:Putative mfs multidrug n=1 Tax=Phaeomoniella chlamydospora TaxID=158046 RepID=A0A0G2GGL0_PHACM|nr:putative mfs multidrug [Phaeomoniella chlamydospora]